MPTRAAEVYLAGFLAQCSATAGADQPVATGPALYGLLPAPASPRTRLFVTDDRAHDALAAALPRAGGGLVAVAASARRCIALLDDDPAWRGGAATAMAACALPETPPTGLPADLTVRPVRRLPTDPPGGVPLADAVAVADRADPEVVADALVEHLRSRPAALRLFAAVDGAGAVRATSGVGIFAGHAHVVFVNTDPRRQGEGIGSAMTALALHDAAGRGAGDAYLDASSAGRGLYARAGFEPVAAVRRFSRER